MPNVKDLKDRTWRVAVTLGGVRRVEQQLGLKLFDMESPVPDNITTMLPKQTVAGVAVPLATMLTTDFALACDVVWILLERQAAEASVDLEEFKDGIDATVGGELRLALLEDLLDFFQQTAQHAMCEILMAAMEAAVMLGGIVAAKLKYKMDQFKAANFGSESTKPAASPNVSGGE